MDLENSNRLSSDHRSGVGLLAGISRIVRILPDWPLEVVALASAAVDLKFDGSKGQQANVRLRQGDKLLEERKFRSRRIVTARQYGSRRCRIRVVWATIR